MDKLPDKYIVDFDLGEKVSRKVSLHKFGIGKKELLPIEISILEYAKSCLDEYIEKSDKSTNSYTQALNKIYSYAERMYRESKIGSWSFAGFRALTDLGKSVTDKDTKCQMARVRFILLIKKMIEIQHIALDSAVGFYLLSMLEIGVGDNIVKVLTLESKQHEEMIEYTKMSPTINDWFLRISELAPLTDSQHIIYKCLERLYDQRNINDFELVNYDELDMGTCQWKDKKLEEISAHTCENALTTYMLFPDRSCSRYISTILNIAKREGPRAAKRQTRFDLARLLVPLFLVNDACKEIDDSEYS